MTPLIVRIHEVHAKRGISDLTCALCVEVVRRADRRRPAWFRYLVAKDYTPRPAA